MLYRTTYRPINQGVSSVPYFDPPILAKNSSSRFPLKLLDNRCHTNNSTNILSIPNQSIWTQQHTMNRSVWAHLMSESCIQFSTYKILIKSCDSLTYSSSLSKQVSLSQLNDRYTGCTFWSVLSLTGSYSQEK